MEHDPHPAFLPQGTRVGPWRLRHLLGRGTYGSVYRADGVRPEASGPAALKLAHAPHDERFGREVGLLSRLHHPGIPRLLGHGHWQAPGGLHHPFLAMELVEGPPLYEWAQAACPTSRQVLQLLAGLARALAAIHAAGGVHRDVKGANILVRTQDGRGFLVDFGAAYYQGASALTWHPFPPGTLAYRAPEAFVHSVQLLQAGDLLLAYSPKPADDVFALGVTAWHLVTGGYPPAPDPREANDFWNWWKAGGPRPVRELNARCSPELGAVISRMLSVRPEARGSAGALAEALEVAARNAGLGADAPLFLQQPPRSGEKKEVLSAPDAPGVHRRRSSRRTAASLSAALTFAAFGLMTWQEWRAPRSEHATEDEGEEDGGTVGLGDELLTAHVAAEHAPPGWPTIGLDLPSKPLRGQRRPDAQGRCPSKYQVAINGGCWRKTINPPEECDEDSYRYKDACYLPVFLPPRPPTSSPTGAPDGGAR